MSAIFNGGRATRRAFLATSASGLALLGTGLKAQAQTPKKGGRMRMALQGGSTSDDLDPAKFNEPYLQIVGFGLRNNLTEISSESKVAPELAESWEPSKDAKTWTFKLRSGVQFHSGKTLDANDVRATFNYHRGANSHSVARGLLTGIEDVKVIDPLTVQFQLKFGNADFPALITDYHLGIMPAKGDEVEWRSGDGTGGYKVTTWNPGVRILMSRNPNYWKKDAAFVDEFEALTVSDVSARQNALMTGEVEVIDRVDLRTIDLLKRNPNIVIENVAGRLHYTYDMRTSVDPFGNNNVRLALKHGINRKVFLEKILYGYGALANDHPISPAYAYFDSSIPQRDYDLDKAKFYVKKSGLSSINVDLSCSDHSYNGAVDAAVLYKEWMAPAGLNINVIREPADGYNTKVWNVKPFVSTYYTGRPTEDGALSLAYIKGAGMNTAKWDNPRVDELVAAARAELDANKRRQQYSEVQRIISDEGGYVIPVFANYVFARSKKLAHKGTLSTDRSLDGTKLTERWWFA
ncbi:MAG: ABC transporter substrate-binding protein [Pseudorhodoplanes sp.]